MGKMTLCFNLDRILVSKDVVYIPVFKHNLISVAKLMDHGHLFLSILVLLSVEIEILFYLKYI
jgi:hypothetical protein